MKVHAFLLACFLLFCAVYSADNAKTNLKRDSGVLCIACTVAMRALEQYTVYREPDIEKALSKFCDLFDPTIGSFCKLFIQIEAKPLIELLEKKAKPDTICKKLRFCEGFEQCNLYPKDAYNGEFVQPKRYSDDPWWKKIIYPFFHALDRHVPLIDQDKDFHSTIETWRGAYWRGRDCDDKNGAIYPGRKTQDSNPNVDSNCNGIKGVNEQGQSYEDLFCSKSAYKGVAILGDSATAHFRIPPQLMDPAYMNKTIYQHVLPLLELEADWPHLSWVTSFKEDDTGLTPGPTSSIYKKMLQRNRCIHRDYQNIGVNGARSGAMKNDISLTLGRNQTNDQPLLLFFALVGNDVCNGHPGDPGTSTQEFHDNIVATLDHLDTVLPKGSHIVFEGLAAGGFLFDILKNETHPIGAPYPNVYEFLTCLHTNPCVGWMNTNATVRNMTTAHAKELSEVYLKIMSERQYNNFKMIYHDFPFEDLLPYIKVPWRELIEPFDGFHPSQLLQSLTADLMWDYLEKNYPEALGDVNPHNDEIVKIFGDQGGY